MRQHFPFRFLVFRLTFLLRFYLELLLLVLRRVFFISALTRCILGPCGLRWKRVPAPKVFLHSRRPTAMGAIAWQRTRRNGQCLLNVCKKNSLHGPPTALQPVKGGHLYARMSVPLVSNCSSTRRWAKASVMGRCILSQGGKRSPFMRMEAIRLLLCVLYVRSRATFSVRHHSGVTLSHHQESVRHVPFL